MHTLPSVLAIERADINPQLEAFFGADEMPHRRFMHLKGLVGQLIDNGNDVFRDGIPEGPQAAIPILLDDEHLDGLVEYLPRQQGPRSTIIAAGNIGTKNVNRQRYRHNISALRELGRLCGKVDLPFSYYDTAYIPYTPIGEIRADMHAGGMLHYQQRMHRLGRPVIDRLMLGSDADIEYMGMDYMGKMQAAFEASDLPAWMGGPRVQHALLGPEFPRINHLLRWYDAFDAAITPTHYGVNMGAYAAVGGMNPSCAFGETYYLRKALQGAFGDSRVAKETVAANVQVSPRHLVDNMLRDGAVLEYGRLHSPLTNSGPSYRNMNVTSDISEKRFIDMLAERANTLYQANFQSFYNDQLSAGTPPALASARARAAAREHVFAISRRLGDVDGSRALVAQLLIEPAKA